MVTRIILILTLVVFGGLALFEAPAFAQSSPGGGPSGQVPKLRKKTCTLRAGACTITLEIRSDPDHPGQFCATATVTCPGETCEFEEVCGLDGNDELSLPCGGADFTVKPNAQKNWRDVWGSGGCSHLEVGLSR